MLNYCTIVIITPWNPNECNCYNEKKQQNPINKIMTFDCEDTIFIIKFLK